MKAFNRTSVRLAVVSVAMLFGGLTGSLAIAADDTDSAAMARGVKSWNENCARCHNVRDPKEMRDDQWMATAFHMRVRAGLTGQETRDILLFLQESN